jgi:hypothetical protein
VDCYTTACVIEGDSERSNLRKVNEPSALPVVHTLYFWLGGPHATPRPTYQWQAVKLSDPELILLVRYNNYRGAEVYWRLQYVLMMIMTLTRTCTSESREFLLFFSNIYHPFVDFVRMALIGFGGFFFSTVRLPRRREVAERCASLSLRGSISVPATASLSFN